MTSFLQFSCSVSTFRANSSHTRSPPKESEGFYAGLKVNILVLSLHQFGQVNSPLFIISPQFSPDSLHIAEDSKEHEVTVHSTVPIPCHGTSHARHCGVLLVLSVQDPGQSRRRNI